MKKLLLSVFAIGLLVTGYAFKTEAIIYAKNAFAVMQSDRGNEILHPGAMPKSYARFSSTTEAVICTGKCAIFDVIFTSGADGAYAVLRDTVAVDATGIPLMLKAEFDGTGIAKGLPSNGLPFVTTIGLTADLSSVSGGEELLILYKDLD